jgi:hypothetical protein
MSSISAVNALQMLQQAQPQQRAANRPGGNDLLAASNGPRGAVSGLGKPMTDAQARINEAMFSVNTVNATAMKVKLIERVGKEFGIDHDDYDNERSYGAAIRNAMAELKNRPDAAMAVTAIEKNLGLDKLGISLETLVNAIFDPKGDDADRLDAALRRQTSQDGKTGDARAAYQDW